GAILPRTQIQLISLLGPELLPALRHLSLVNVLFIRPYDDEHVALTAPPLDSLHIHLDRDRRVFDVDLTYLLSTFISVRHLSLTGCPTITVLEEDPDDEEPEYRHTEPEVLTVSRISSYLPYLRASSSTVLKNLASFKAGLFDIPLLDSMEVAALHQIFTDAVEGSTSICLYYTLLDRVDRCRVPDFSPFLSFVHTFTLQFSLYEEESNLVNSSIWALAAKTLSTLIPINTPNFHLRTVVLKISGREQPTNWIPDLYDHHDLVAGLRISCAHHSAKLVEDTLLRLLEARDVLGDDGDESGGGLVVKIAPHDHAPPFDARICRLLRGVLPRLDAMNILSF
ncbi:hypothetical protein EIP91_010346, partial [Steccherinum ochraceum]